MNTQERHSCLVIGEVFNLPEGYELKDQDGNVINATKIVLEKKDNGYPKTYEECCEILGYQCNWLISTAQPEDANKITKNELQFEYLIIQFKKLLICRDAYWKLYGEEMGLGKPWSPDWTIESSKYIILFKETKIEKHITCKYSRILAFPTEEMRDAFYENFKKEIEFCKELL